MTKGHQALFTAFAQHPHHPLLHIHVLQLQAHQFAHAQAAGIQQLQHRPIPQAQRGGGIGRGQQLLHLCLTEHMGHAGRALGGQQQHAGIVLQALLLQGPVVIAAQNTQTPVAGSGLGPLGRTLGLPGLQILRLCAIQAHTAFGQKLRTGAGIAPVGFQGVFSQPVLEQQGFQKSIQTAPAGSQQGLFIGRSRIGHSRQ